jgi:alpha-tubulin suppressor-like RCC1 family protein
MEATMKADYRHTRISLNMAGLRLARLMVSMLFIVTIASGAGACGGGGGGSSAFEIKAPPRGSNNAPVLEPVPDQVTFTDTGTSFTVVASDADGDRITFRAGVVGANNEVDFGSISKTSPTTALEEIQPDYDNEGVYYLGVEATDDSGSFFNSDLERFILTIRAAENPPRSFYRLPELIGDSPQATATGLGGLHSCMAALASEGASLSDTLCWGNNESGQLGFQSGPATCGEENSPCTDSPGRVDVPVSLVSLDGSAQHSCGLTADGQAWCWGLGYGGTVPMAVPTDLRFVELKTAPTDNTTCGLTETRQLYCWRPDAAPEQAAEGFSFTTFDLGGDFACGIDPERRTFCWGNNWYGQLGMGLGTIGQEGGPVSSDVPVEVFGNHRFSTLALGLMHACGLKGGGDAYCWGYMVSRTGRETLTAVPQGVSSDDSQAPGEAGFRQIASGDLFACGIYRGLNGVTACWGDLDVGRVPSDFETTFALESILLDPNITPQSIATGGSHACGIVDGATYCWGDNSHAQLGRLPGGSP